MRYHSTGTNNRTVVSSTRQVSLVNHRLLPGHQSIPVVRSPSRPSTTGISVVQHRGRASETTISNQSPLHQPGRHAPPPMASPRNFRCCQIASGASWHRQFERQCLAGCTAMLLANFSTTFMLLLVVSVQSTVIINFGY